MSSPQVCANALVRGVGGGNAPPMASESKVASATREMAAPASRVFELIADPSRQPEWDGNENLSHAAPGQRVRSVGDVFSMTLTKGEVRENNVVEFIQGQPIAWNTTAPGPAPVGHAWRWACRP